MNKQTTLRLCSYNIHKGFSAGNTEYLIRNIRSAVRKIDADLLFLQEVVGESKHDKHGSWMHQSQFEFLADSVWHHYAYGKNAEYDDGHHGNAILSRYPLNDTVNIDVSLIPYSRRGILCTQIHPEIYLFCIHFGLIAFERQQQLKKLIDIVNATAGQDKSVIIAGDFNDWRNSVGKRLRKAINVKDALLEKYGKLQRTFPSQRPIFPMDTIYYRGLELTEAKVLNGDPWNRLSDHCAVFAEFNQIK